MFRKLAVAAVVLLALTACDPVDAGRGKPVSSHTQPAGGYGDGNSIVIKHRIGAEAMLTFDASADYVGNRWERTAPFEYQADVSAERDFTGALGCQIWYRERDHVWLVAIDDKPTTGGVFCHVDTLSLAKKLKTPGQPVDKCDCTIGNGDVQLLVTWIKTKP
jgi:hypothetical protein